LEQSLLIIILFKRCIEIKQGISLSEIGKKLLVSTKNPQKNQPVELAKVTVIEEKEVLEFYSGVLDDKHGLKVTDLDGNEYPKKIYIPRLEREEDSWIGKKTDQNVRVVWYDVEQ